MPARNGRARSLSFRTFVARPTGRRYCGGMEEGGRIAELDARLPRPVRTYLEERLWRPIEAQATLEVLSDDPSFLADPGHHPAIFADHGVVHVRDVAIGLIRLARHDQRRAAPEPPAGTAAVRRGGRRRDRLPPRHRDGRHDPAGAPGPRAVRGARGVRPRCRPARRAPAGAGTGRAPAWTRSPIERRSRRRSRSSSGRSSA